MPAPKPQHTGVLLDIDRAKAKPVYRQAASAAQVDRYAELDGLVERFKPTRIEHECLRAVLLPGDEFPGDADAVAHGVTMDVLITMRDNARTVTPQGKRKFLKMLGATEFLKRCTLALKQLPDPKDPTNLFSIQDRTGPRHLTVVALPRLQAAA
jgi:hypothetical protein